MTVCFEEITALYEAQKYGDISDLIKLIREGNKAVIESEAIRNFIADLLEGKNKRGRGKKPASRKKEMLELWVAHYICVFLGKEPELALYHSTGSNSKNAPSAFSKLKDIAMELGYKNLNSNESIKKALKSYFSNSKSIPHSAIIEIIAHKLVFATDAGNSSTDISLMERRLQIELKDRLQGYL